jgi:hypothetical protein
VNGLARKRGRTKSKAIRDARLASSTPRARKKRPKTLHDAISHLLGSVTGDRRICRSAPGEKFAALLRTRSRQRSWSTNSRRRTTDAD